MGNGVWNWCNRTEPKHALGVTGHHAAAIGPLPARVLHIIVARGIGLPDIDLHVGDGVAVGVVDGADDEEGFAGGIVGDGGAGGKGRGVVGVEGAEDGAFGAVGGFGVVD